MKKREIVFIVLTVIGALVGMVIANVVGLFIALVINYKIYEAIYYRSEDFNDLRTSVEDYIEECNELNQHIEELKETQVTIDQLDSGIATYRDNSNWNFKRKNLSKIKVDTNVHQCSRSVCDNARKDPFKYVCKYFGIKKNEESLAVFESMLNNFSAAEQGKQNLINEENEIIDSIQNDIPWAIKKFSKKKLKDNLGFEHIDLSTAYFPKYQFQYVSSGGNASLETEIEFNIENLNLFVEYLNREIKWKKSVAGQRALMTSKLRNYILTRDGYKCKYCGANIEDEPNLLLEVDHIVPLAKGGMTNEENLQTLCWKCNRSKGSKIVMENQPLNIFE